MTAILSLPLAMRAEDANQRLKIFTQSEGGKLHFYLRNSGMSPVTTTIELTSENVQGTVEFPHTFAVGPNETYEAFALSLKDSQVPWHYNYTNYSTLGRFDTVPDGNHVYELPFAAGSQFNVSQGFHGKFSHCGPDEYAVDFQMPEGTPVHAARGGMVIDVKDNHWEGGPDKRWEACANTILIQHHDGTIGIYGHLREGGSQVKTGDVVMAGQMIAFSGNTGFTSGPHLHFAVFKPKNGRERESFPIQFFTGNHGIATPMAGIQYLSTAPAVVADPSQIKRQETNAGVRVSLIRKLQIFN